MKSLDVKTDHGRLKTYKRGLILLLLCLSLASTALCAPQNSQSYERLERAVEMIREGKLAQAEADLNIILRAEPREPNALNLLGVVRAQQQRLNEAERLFLRALEVAPTLLGAYLNLGQLYLGSRKSDRALWAFQEASKLKPDRPDINYNLAELYEERRDYQRALDHIEKIPRSDLGADQLSLLVKCYLGLGRTKEAQSVAASLSQSGALEGEAAALLATAFAERGLFDQAIEMLEAARRQTPNSFPVLYNLGASYYQKGELSRAEEVYTAALGIRPDDVTTLRALASVARARGDFERALVHLIRARKLAPDSAPVLYDFGWTALNLNLLADAIPVLDRLHQMQPDEPGYLYALAIARLQNGEGAQAQALLNRYIELRPQDARGYYVLGATLYGLKQFPQARAALEQSLKFNIYADAEYYLGMIAHNEGDATQAIQWLERTLKSEPAHASAHTALGTVYAKQKNYTAARTELERAIELNPKDMTAHYQLGIVYARLGEKERSQSAFAVAEELRKEQRVVVGLKLADQPK